MIQQVLFSCYKGIYKCKLVNSLPVDLWAFFHPAKTSIDLYRLNLEAQLNSEILLTLLKRFFLALSKFIIIIDGLSVIEIMSPTTSQIVYSLLSYS